MITYVDTSTVIKLIVDEDGSDRALSIWNAADAVASVRLIIVEARAALAAAARSGRLSTVEHVAEKETIGSLDGSLHVVDVTEELIAEAAALAESQGLRGYDAVHLAGALRVGASIMTSADHKLCDAAAAAGMHIANLSEEPLALRH